MKTHELYSSGYSTQRRPWALCRCGHRQEADTHADAVRLLELHHVKVRAA